MKGVCYMTFSFIMNVFCVALTLSVAFFILFVVYEKRENLMKISVKDMESLIGVLNNKSYKHHFVFQFTQLLSYAMHFMLAYVIQFVCLTFVEISTKLLLQEQVTFSITYYSTTIVAGIIILLQMCYTCYKFHFESIEKIELKLGEKGTLSKLVSILGREKLLEYMQWNIISGAMLSFLLIMGFGLYFKLLPSDMFWYMIFFSLLCGTLTLNVVTIMNINEIRQCVAIEDSLNDTELSKFILEAYQEESHSVEVHEKFIHGKLENAIYAGVFDVKRKDAIENLRPNETIRLWLNLKTVQALGKFNKNVTHDNETKST